MARLVYWNCTMCGAPCGSEVDWRAPRSSVSVGWQRAVLRLHLSARDRDERRSGGPGLTAAGHSGVKATASEAAWEGAVQEDVSQLWRPGERKALWSRSERNDLHSERLRRRSPLVKHLRKAYHGPLLLLAGSSRSA